ncbi:MAG TPA: TraB/GumN family protein [Burkholderiales bacterium]|nr:TraB/GumN family protein [Burkholderiales bacterium]
MSVPNLIRRFVVLIAVAASAHAFALDSAARLPLWEVRSDTGTVYLLGTIHVGRPDFYPLPPAVEDAYRASELVALELDPTNDEAINAAISTGMYAPPDNLAQHIPGPLLEDLKRALARYGVPLETFTAMKPFMVVLSLSAIEYGRLGYDPMMGLDIHFAESAAHDGKRIVEFESAASQIAMMDGLSQELQQALLRVTIEDIDRGRVAADVAEMLDAWQSGDAVRLGKALSTEERELPSALAKEFHEKFLTRRNAAMADRIERLLRDGKRCFAAVGAGHLIGDDGVVALLAKKGYRIRQI